MDSLNLINSLPHKYPFLFIDKIVEIKEDEIIAQKNVSINEWFFEGHFPNKPV
ncbi:MAG: 3-hydroxyacyl-[acyl-carrier-protein] dehydratase FabZ, partial [bacterium]